MNCLNVIPGRVLNFSLAAMLACTAAQASRLSPAQALASSSAQREAEPEPEPAKPIEPGDLKPSEPSEPADEKTPGTKPMESQPAAPNDKAGEPTPEKSSRRNQSEAATAAAAKIDVPDSPAKAILRRSANAVKGANSLSFKIKLFGEGGMLAGAPTLEADVKMLKAPGSPNTWLIRALGTGSNATSGKEGATKTVDPAAFDVVWTTTTTSWIEPADKTVYTRPLNASRGKASQAASSAKLRYFTLPNPFQKELQPTEFTQEDSATVNGEMCDITATTGDRGSHDRYSISQRDGFPRRIEKIFDTDRVRGRYVTEFTNVKVNEDISEAYFKIPIPDGYKEDIQDAAKPTVTDAAKLDTSKTGIEASVPPANAIESTPAGNAGLHAASGGEVGPDMDLPLSGGTIKLSSLRGNVVVLDFFGTWALTSKAAHEEFKKSFEKFKDRPVRFMSFAVREKNPDAAAEYLGHNQFTWDFAKRGDPVAIAFNVKTFPFWIVMDQEGKIKFRGLGSKSDSPGKLDDAISDALGLERAHINDASAENPSPAGIPAPSTPPGGSAGVVPSLGVPPLSEVKK